MNNRSKRGFTLIELLVVVSVIALLISLLLPALTQARVKVREVQCSSNLRQWGLIWAYYHEDYRGQLPRPATYSGIPYPGLIRTPGSELNDEWSVSQIEPYMQSRIDVANRNFPGMWFCPSTDTAQWENYWESWWSGVVHSPYAFWSHASEYANRLSEPDEIVDQDLNARQMIMNDQVYRWAWQGTWMINHGKQGNSIHSDPEAYRGAPPIVGNNMLYGDGHVVWRAQSEFDPSLMESTTTVVGATIRVMDNGFGNRFYW